MQLQSDLPYIRITPDINLSQSLINSHIENKGGFAVHDAIKETMNYDSYSQSKTFRFSGIHPYTFKSYHEAMDFMTDLNKMVEDTMSSVPSLKIPNVDDILFITFFHFSLDGEVESDKANEKYLDELIDVFINLLESPKSPSDSQYVWMQDTFTGIETQVDRATLSQKELLDNDGYKVESHMIPPSNHVYHFASDRPLVMQARDNDIQPIYLPPELSRQLTKFTISHIINKHRIANTPFYKELQNGYLDLHQWRNRSKPRNYIRLNRVLSKLIFQLEKYLHSYNKSSLITTRRAFIYDVFALLQLMPHPLKMQRSDKALAIRSISKYNPI